MRFDFLHDAPAGIVADARAVRIPKSYHGVLAAACVAVAFCFGAAVLERARVAEARLERLQAQERFDRSRNELAALQLQWQQIAALLETDRRLRAIRLSGAMAAARLAEVGNDLPQDATLSSLRAGSTGYACKGTSPNLRAFGDMLDALARDRTLPRPDAVRLTQDESALAPLAFEIGGGLQ